MSKTYGKFANHTIVAGSKGLGLVVGIYESEPDSIYLVPVANPERGFGLSREAVLSLADLLKGWATNGGDLSSDPPELPWDYVPVYRRSAVSVATWVPARDPGEGEE